MHVIPVIDLKDGRVVRGVAGQRESYQPIRSRLVNSSLPADVAAAFRRVYGLNDLYLADLNAIAGDEPAWDVYQQLLHDDYRLSIDAGVANLERAHQLAEFAESHRGRVRVIVGLESVQTPSVLIEMATAVGLPHCIFSLDLFEGQNWNSSPQWKEMSALDAAACAVNAGIESIIVLELSDVGRGGGTSTLQLCRDLRARHSKLTLIAGGGVRDERDLERLGEAGCDGALVASALHDGRLPPT